MHLLRGQGDGAGAAGKGVFQGKADNRFLVRTSAGTVKWLSTAGPSALLTKSLAEQGFEEIAEIAAPGLKATAGTGRAPAEVKAAFPSGRGTEILALLPVLAEPVVFLTFFRVFQYLVGFVDFLETLLGVRRLVDVRMIFAGQLAIGPLDILLLGVTVHAQYLVIVFVCCSHIVLSLQPLRFIEKRLIDLSG